MILSEFVLTKTIGDRPLNLEYFASVSVTTGALWWKKIERKTIHREYGGYWHFVDDGKFTPFYQVEELERAYKAKETLKS